MWLLATFDTAEKLFRTSVLAAFPWACSGLAQIIFAACALVGYCGLLLVCVSHKCKQPFFCMQVGKSLALVIDQYQIEFGDCHARVAVGS